MPLHVESHKLRIEPPDLTPRYDPTPRFDYSRSPRSIFDIPPLPSYRQKLALMASMGRAVKV